MRQELSLELVKRYPELFVDTPFVNISCGDGWFNIIDMICLELYSDYKSAKSIYETCIENNGGKLYPWIEASPIVTVDMVKESYLEMHKRFLNLPKIVQIKEKFGSLRFYASGISETMSQKISFAELMSTKICEVCGSSAPNDVMCYSVGFRKTLCRKCQLDISTGDRPSNI